MLFTTRLILFDDHDRVFALLFRPTNNITYPPALDSPSGKFTYEASVKATILRSSTVPKLGLKTGVLLMSQLKFKTSKDISGLVWLASQLA